MKKKFFVLYALAGAFVVSPILTSCVDDDESASVTAVREAKAEQLKGLAALANAQAQAETTKASAEAALYAAEAEYQKALAESALANAAATTASTERANEEFAAELERIKAENEYNTAKYALWLEEQKQQVISNGNEQISTAADNYIKALGTLADLNKQLVSAKLTLSQVQANADYAEAATNAYVVEKTNQINSKTLQIAVLEASKDKDADTLYDEYLASITAAKEAAEAWQEAQDALEAANDAVDAAEYLTHTAALDEAGYSYDSKNGLVDSKATANSVVESATASKKAADEALKTAQDNLKKAQDALAAEQKKEKPDAATVATLKSDVDTAQKAVNDATDEVAASQKVLDDANAIVASLEAVTEGSAVQKEYEALVEAQEAAEKAEDDAEEASLEANAVKDALKIAYEDEASIDQQIANLEKEIAEAKRDIETYSAGGYNVYDSNKEWDYSAVWTDEDGVQHKDTYYFKYYQYVDGTFADVETLTAAAQADIDKLEEQIAIQEIVVANYKSQLEALVGSIDGAASDDTTAAE
jgi:hypothetical protein